MATITACDQCGAPITGSDPSARFCRFCGAKLAIATPPTPPPNLKREDRSEILRQQLEELREKWEHSCRPYVTIDEAGNLIPPDEDTYTGQVTTALGVIGFLCVMSFAVLGRSFRSTSWGAFIKPEVGFVLFFALPMLGAGIDAVRSQKKKRKLETYQRLRKQYEAAREDLIERFESRR